MLTTFGREYVWVNEEQNLIIAVFHVNVANSTRSYYTLTTNRYRNYAPLASNTSSINHITYIHTHTHTFRLQINMFTGV